MLLCGGHTLRMTVCCLMHIVSYAVRQTIMPGEKVRYENVRTCCYRMILVNGEAEWAFLVYLTVTTPLSAVY